MTRSACLFAFAATVLTPACPLIAAAPVTVELLVTDGAGAIDAPSYPVKVGVPLSYGAFEDTSCFRVVDADGRECHAQYTWRQVQVRPAP